MIFLMMNILIPTKVIEKQEYSFRISTLNSMKFICSFILLFCLQLNAQDTLCFRNGDVKTEKVTEIAPSEIKYYRNLYGDGPLYVVYKSNVAEISYASGQKDVFNSVSKSPTQVSPMQSQQPVVNYIPANKLEITDKKVYLNGRAVEETRMQRMIFALDDMDKKARLQKKLNEMKGYKKKQYAFGFSGIGAAVGSVYAGMMMMVLSYEPVYFVGGFVGGVAFGVTGGILAKTFKDKRIKAFLETAKLYNE